MQPNNQKWCNGAFKKRISQKFPTTLSVQKKKECVGQEHVPALGSFAAVWLQICFSSLWSSQSPFRPKPSIGRSSKATIPNWTASLGFKRTRLCLTISVVKSVKTRRNLLKICELRGFLKLLMIVDLLDRSIWKS